MATKETKGTSRRKTAWKRILIKRKRKTSRIDRASDNKAREWSIVASVSLNRVENFLETWSICLKDAEWCTVGTIAPISLEIMLNHLKARATNELEGRFSSSLTVKATLYICICDLAISTWRQLFFSFVRQTIILKYAETVERYL